MWMIVLKEMLEAPDLEIDLKVSERKILEFSKNAT